jgi:hypothetical protein
MRSLSVLGVAQRSMDFWPAAFCTWCADDLTCRDKQEFLRRIHAGPCPESAFRRKNDANDVLADAAISTAVKTNGASRSLHSSVGLRPVDAPPTSIRFFQELLIIRCANSAMVRLSSRARDLKVVHDSRYVELLFARRRTGHISRVLSGRRAIGGLSEIPKGVIFVRGGEECFPIFQCGYFRIGLDRG